MTTRENTNPRLPADAEAGPAVRGTLKIGKWVGLMLLLAIVALPTWASIRYRLAVGNLHEELADIQPASAELVDSYVSSCYNEVAPASVRIFKPVGDANLNTVKSDYIWELRSRSFGPGSLGNELVWGRERDDDLDSDDVRFEADEAANTLTVIADTYDIDMVACIPFSGRK